MSAKHYGFDVRFTRDGEQIIGALPSGTHFRVDERGLANASCRVGSLARDLYRIAMCVYATDRLAMRGRTTRDSSGARSLIVRIPVVHPDFWQASETEEPLLAALEMLSDDRWCFEFTRCFLGGFQQCLEFGGQPTICLYSGGLDSAAGLAARLFSVRGPVLAVTAVHQPHQLRGICRQLGGLRRRYPADLQRLIARAGLINPPRMRRQELSQRYRSFLFTSLGGAAACSTGASEVEIYENGVGALNLPLMSGMLVGGKTTRGAHPQFLERMGRLVTRVVGRPIRFVLPFSDRTKAEVVKTLSLEGLEEVARQTVSCVHYPRRVPGRAKQCGWCPACIGRRQALITAGISGPSDLYEVDLFGDPSTVNSIDQKYLTCLKAMLMQVASLYDLPNGRSPNLRDTIPRHILLSIPGEPPDALARWVDVLIRYRNEWEEILREGRRRGWAWASWLPAGVAA
jgi:hypothetical protein